MPRDALLNDFETLKAMLFAEWAQTDRLRQIVKDLQRDQFGRPAQTLPEADAARLEEVELAAHHAAEAEQLAPAAQRAGAAKRWANRGALPTHLSRIETTNDIDHKTCRCCRGALHQIGEDKSEQLDIVPAQFRVLVTIRPRYGCRQYKTAVVQARGAGAAD